MVSGGDVLMVAQREGSKRESKSKEGPLQGQLPSASIMVLRWALERPCTPGSPDLPSARDVADVNHLTHSRSPSDGHGLEVVRGGMRDAVGRCAFRLGFAFRPHRGPRAQVMYSKHLGVRCCAGSMSHDAMMGADGDGK